MLNNSLFLLVIVTMFGERMLRVAQFLSVCTCSIVIVVLCASSGVRAGAWDPTRCVPVVPGLGAALLGMGLLTVIGCSIAGDGSVW